MDESLVEYVFWVMDEEREDDKEAVCAVGGFNGCAFRGCKSGGREDVSDGLGNNA